MSPDLPTWHPSWSQPDPAPEPFRVASTHLTARLSIVEVTGELDISTCPEFVVHLDRELYDQNLSDVVVDLSDLRFIDVRGIRSLLLAEQRARAQHIGLQVVAPSGLLTRLLTLLDLDGRIRIQPDVGTARRAVG